jgi:hypothetical protein
VRRSACSMLVLLAFSLAGLCGCAGTGLDRLPFRIGPDYSNVVPQDPAERGVPAGVIQKVSGRLQVPAQPHDIVSGGDVFQTVCSFWPFPEPGPASQQAADTLLLEVRQLLVGSPVLVYKSIQWRGGFDTVADGLVVCPGTDQVDILRFERTEALHYGLYTDDIMQDIVNIDAHYKVTIVGANPQGVEVVMREPPQVEEARAFGIWLSRLAPDLGEAPTQFPDGRFVLWWQ